jgi:hypothetical protein
MNKVVARFADGTMIKGFTTDFVPAKDLFHVAPADAPPGTKPAAVQTKDLKALFFVRDLAGDPQYQDSQEFNPLKPPVGRKIRVRFKDGEVLVGTTQGYQPGRPGFFPVPADPGSNIERCYVISAATDEVTFL